NVGNWNRFKFVATGVVSPPAAPSTLVATPASSTQVNLTWADNSNNENNFILERKAGAGGTYQLLATPAANATTYQDLTAQASTQYFYRIRATNSAGDSANSNEASATTPAPAGTVFLSDLSWVSATNGYGPVEKDTSNGSSGTGDGHVITLNGVTYSKGLGCHADSDITYNLA